MDNIATQIPITIYQGETFILPLTYIDEATNLPVDLTPYTAKMQIRDSAAASSVLVELTTSNGGITLGGTAGTIQILITSTQTLALVAGEAAYDLFLIDGTTYTRLMGGEVEIKASVTQ